MEHYLFQVIPSWNTIYSKSFRVYTRFYHPGKIRVLPGIYPLFFSGKILPATICSIVARLLACSEFNVPKLQKKRKKKKHYCTQQKTLKLNFRMKMLEQITCICINCFLIFSMGLLFEVSSYFSTILPRFTTNADGEEFGDATRESRDTRRS